MVLIGAGCSCRLSPSCAQEHDGWVGHSPHSEKLLQMQIGVIGMTLLVCAWEYQQLTLPRACGNTTCTLLRAVPHIMSQHAALSVPHGHMQSHLPAAAQQAPPVAGAVGAAQTRILNLTPRGAVVRRRIAQNVAPPTMLDTEVMRQLGSAMVSLALIMSRTWPMVAHYQLTTSCWPHLVLHETNRNLPPPLHEEVHGSNLQGVSASFPTCQTCTTCACMPGAPLQALRVWLAVMLSSSNSTPYSQRLLRTRSHTGLVLRLCPTRC